MFVKLLCLFKVQEKYCSAFLLTRLDIFGSIKSTSTIKKMFEKYSICRLDVACLKLTLGPQLLLFIAL